LSFWNDIIIDNNKYNSHLIHVATFVTGESYCWSDGKQCHLTDNLLTINWRYYPSINRDSDRWQITAHVQRTVWQIFVCQHSPCFDFGKLYVTIIDYRNITPFWATSLWRGVFSLQYNSSSYSEVWKIIMSI